MPTHWNVKLIEVASDTTDISDVCTPHEDATRFAVLVDFAPPVPPLWPAATTIPVPALNHVKQCARMVLPRNIVCAAALLSVYVKVDAAALATHSSALPTSETPGVFVDVCVILENVPPLIAHPFGKVAKFERNSGS